MFWHRLIGTVYKASGDMSPRVLRSAVLYALRSDWASESPYSDCPYSDCGMVSCI